MSFLVLYSNTFPIDLRTYLEEHHLENEISTKDNLTEQTQRLKDELNGKLFTILRSVQPYLLYFFL